MSGFSRSSTGRFAEQKILSAKFGSECFARFNVMHTLIIKTGFPWLKQDEHIELLLTPIAPFLDIAPTRLVTDLNAYDPCAEQLCSEI